VRLGVSIAFVATALILKAESRTPVRWNDTVGLEKITADLLQFEFQRLFARSGMERWAKTSEKVEITIRLEPSDGSADALGATLVRNGKPLPIIEIYLAPILRELAPVAGKEQISRALARVAAHELGHYYRGTALHDAVGLMAERLGAEALTREDCQAFFRR
jgi:hypothetical protein